MHHHKLTIQLTLIHGRGDWEKSKSLMCIHSSYQAELCRQSLCKNAYNLASTQAMMTKHPTPDSARKLPVCMGKLPGARNLK